MKKLIIALVCVGLLAALIIPSIYSAARWPTYTLEFKVQDESGNYVDAGTVVQCGANKRFISSSSDEDFRPNLCLVLWDENFGYYDYEICTYPPEGRYLDFTKHKTEITMQFFFIDENGKKVQLNVYDGELKVKGSWLSDEFVIVFDGDYAVLSPTKGKRDPLWEGNVDITILCKKE